MAVPLFRAACAFLGSLVPVQVGLFVNIFGHNNVTLGLERWGGGEGRALRHAELEQAYHLNGCRTPGHSFLQIFEERERERERERAGAREKNRTGSTETCWLRVFCFFWGCFLGLRRKELPVSWLWSPRCSSCWTWSTVFGCQLELHPLR